LRAPLSKVMLSLHRNIIHPLVPKGTSHTTKLLRKLGNYYEKMGIRTAEDFYLRLVAIYDNKTIVRGANNIALLSPTKISPPNFAEWMMLQDALSYFPGDIMAKVDRASMAVSLETRTPFTDPDLIAFAWQLPISMRIQQNKGKWLLRQLLYRYVPPALIERPKSGFSIPLAAWLRGPLKTWAGDLLASDTLTREGYFDAAMVQKLWHSHQSGERDREHQLWNILMFQSWLHHHKR
jgi:asparagine synthase (glutamine-hydrolysing)